MNISPISVTSGNGLVRKSLCGFFLKQVKLINIFAGLNNLFHEYIEISSLLNINAFKILIPQKIVLKVLKAAASQSNKVDK